MGNCIKKIGTAGVRVNKEEFYRIMEQIYRQRGGIEMSKKQQKFYCKVGQATINVLCFISMLAIETVCLVAWVLKQEGGRLMDNCTRIYLWFEETNAKMQNNFREIKAKNNRTRCLENKTSSK